MCPLKAHSPFVVLQLEPFTLWLVRLNWTLWPHVCTGDSKPLCTQQICCQLSGVKEAIKHCRRFGRSNKFTWLDSTILPNDLATALIPLSLDRCFFFSFLFQCVWLWASSHTCYALSAGVPPHSVSFTSAVPSTMTHLPAWNMWSPLFIAALGSCSRLPCSLNPHPPLYLSLSFCTNLQLTSFTRMTLMDRGLSGSAHYGVLLSVSLVASERLYMIFYTHLDDFKRTNFIHICI